MSDPTTSRIPRETLVGLLASTTDTERERITARMPAVLRDELLGEGPLGEDEVPIDVDEPVVAEQSSAGDLVVRFATGTETSRYVILWSFTLTILLGALVFVLA
jgi:hypothetical protein